MSIRILTRVRDQHWVDVAVDRPEFRCLWATAQATVLCTNTELAYNIYTDLYRHKFYITVT